MGRYFTAAFAIGLAMSTTGTSAQVSAVAEAQLDRGFLGDQNSRLAAGNGSGPEDSFQVRAADALARKDYGRALAILRPYRVSDPLAYRWLAGQAYLGKGDFSAARTQFAGAVKWRKNFTPAQVALGLIEAQHGDKSAALEIVKNLTERRAACAGKCKDDAELANGILSIEAALKLRPD